MKSHKRYRNIIIVGASLLILPGMALGQSDSLSPKTVDTVSADGSRAKIHSLYTGLGGGTNLIYLGSTISDGKPFYSASLTYGYRNSLFVSASALHMSGTDPFVSLYATTLNYSHSFNSWFDISADVAGYKTAGSYGDSLFSDFASVNLTTGFDWKLIYTRVSLYGLISDENGFYLQVRNSRYFETPEFFKGKARVSFDPDIDMLFGELVNVETLSGMKLYGKTAPFIHYGKRNGSPGENSNRRFGLLDFEFSIPVTFSYGNFSLEGTASYLLPVRSDPYYPVPKGFSFFLSAMFKIF
jgi:hypothetical protein